MGNQLTLISKKSICTCSPGLCPWLPPFVFQFDNFGIKSGFQEKKNLFVISSLSKKLWIKFKEDV